MFGSNEHAVGMGGVEDHAVQVKMAVQGIDYNSLLANEKLTHDFEESMKSAIASGRDINQDEMSIELSNGSVIVKAGVSPASGSPDALLANLQSSKDAIASKATDNVKALPGRQAITNGNISVSVLDIAAQAPPPYAGGPPPIPGVPHLPARTASYAGSEDTMGQKCAAPRMGRNDGLYRATSERSRPGDLSQPPSLLMEDFSGSPNAASLVSSPKGSQTGGYGRMSPKGSKSKAGKAAKPATGSPDDIKNLLSQLQSNTARKQVPSPSGESKERIKLDVPAHAEDEFEKQLLKVSRLTDQKAKADLRGPLNEMSFQDPPEHIRGLAVRQALKEISGTEEEKLL